MPFDVVIAGGGFGGLYAALRLERRLPRHSARITVVSEVRFLVGDYLDDMLRAGETPRK